MARRVPPKEQLVKLIVGAGQASPSPPVGPALGSKGVKSMDFCKEFNALTAHITPGTPIPAVITVRPDRTFHFTLRTPPTATLLLAAARVKPSKNAKVRGANAPGRPTEPVSRAAAPDLLAASAAGVGAATTGAAKTDLTPGDEAPGGAVARQVARASGGDKEVGMGGGVAVVGQVSLKHVFEIAKIKQSEERLKGMSLEGLVKSVIAQARTVGVDVVP